MQVSFLSLLFLSALVQIYAQDADYGILEDDISSRTKPISCETREKRRGYCVSTVKCRRLLNNRFQNPKICFFRSETPYVCCPLKLKPPAGPPSIQPTPRPPRPTPVSPPRTPSRPPSRTPSRSPPTSSGSPNSKLDINPSGCGRRPYQPAQGSGLVVGGHEVEKYSWPWMAAIRTKTFGENTQFLCGGSLITKKHVLSAAHCFGQGRGFKPASDYRVVLGSHYRGGNSPGNQLNEEGITIVTPSKIRVHENYKNDAHDDDVAVLTLSREVEINKRVTPVCLPLAQQQNPKIVTVLGWGDTEYGGVNSKTLQEATFEVVSFPKCRSIFQHIPVASLSKGITSKMLCAGDLTGAKDSCQNDSGGPLLEENVKENKYYQVGVVSWGFRCAEKGYPGVYVRVSSYTRWIQNVVRSS